jgi:plasmid stability protein
MIRTHIQLTEEQSKKLKAAAARKGISVAELIRQGIDASLEKEASPSRDELVARVVNAAGRFKSLRHDVARRHDRYLGESFHQ